MGGYVVTGAAGGIGGEIMQRLVARGDAVIAVDREGSPAIESLCRTGSVTFLSLDVADEGHAADMLECCVRRHGRFSGAALCAGTIRFEACDQITLEHWDRVLSVNLRSVLVALREIARMPETLVLGASVVTISSTSARGARPEALAYGASKHGVEYLTRSYALALAARRVRVNGIAPGPIRTAMWNHVARARGGPDEGAAREYEQRVLEATPLGRLGEPADIAELASFLLSEAAGFITGQTIVADGGFLLANR